jgi:RNA polymerase sigma-70 factor (ECF subfamily)
MDDGFLIRQVLGGNRNAFRLLVIRYQRSLFRFLGGMGFEVAAAEELAQEAFLRAYRSLADYDPGKAKFSSWLFTIAKHLAQNEAARSHRRAPHVELPEEASAAALPAPSPSPQETLEQAERGRRVRQAIGKLPNFLRGTLVLAYLKGLSMQDIASIESCSVGTVRSRISRGKQLLRASLAESEE